MEKEDSNQHRSDRSDSCPYRVSYRTGKLPCSNDYYGYQTTSVGSGDFLRFSKSKEKNNIEEIFSSKQYDYISPYNMEDEDEPDDEAAANSIINSKQFYIEFKQDFASPKCMFDFIENSVMFYAKQVIPSTTILKYYIALRDDKSSVCGNDTYIQSALITK